MTTLSEQVAKIGQRVGALETKGINTADGIARITKIYGNIQITTTITAYLHTYRKCGDTNPIYPATCGTDTYL
jgi:hypothetical protein